MAKKINITAQLNAATTDGILADAGQIFDTKKGKFQEQVNQEFEDALEEAITSEDTGVVVESIEEGIVHNALRKNKQILTEAEKYQARHNISAITAEEAEKIAQDKINESAVSSPDKLQAVKELSSWLEENPDNAATMNAAIQENAADIQRLYRGTGIDEYSQFSTGMDYAAGDVVLYDGVLFRFKADHAKGEWDYNEVEEWSEKKEREEKLAEFEQEVRYIDSGHLYDSYIGEYVSARYVIGYKASIRINITEINRGENQYLRVALFSQNKIDSIFLIENIDIYSSTRVVDLNVEKGQYLVIYFPEKKQGSFFAKITVPSSTIGQIDEKISYITTSVDVLNQQSNLNTARIESLVNTTNDIQESQTSQKGNILSIQGIWESNALFDAKDNNGYVSAKYDILYDTILNISLSNVNLGGNSYGRIAIFSKNIIDSLYLISYQDFYYDKTINLSVVKGTTLAIYYPDKKDGSFVVTIKDPNSIALQQQERINAVNAWIDRGTYHSDAGDKVFATIPVIYPNLTTCIEISNITLPKDAYLFYFISKQASSDSSYRIGDFSYIYNSIDTIKEIQLTEEQKISGKYIVIVASTVGTTFYTRAYIKDSQLVKDYNLLNTSIFSKANILVGGGSVNANNALKKFIIEGTIGIMVNGERVGLSDLEYSWETPTGFTYRNYAIIYNVVKGNLSIIDTRNLLTEHYVLLTFIGKGGKANNNCEVVKFLYAPCRCSVDGENKNNVGYAAYTGKKIDVGNSTYNKTLLYGSSDVNIVNKSNAQGAAIYADRYIFQFDAEKNIGGFMSVVDINNMEVVSEFALNLGAECHGNNICFGRKYSVDDTFPTLYISEGDSINEKFRCFVLRLANDLNSFEIVQTIEFKGERYESSRQRDWMVDAENNLLYTYSKNGINQETELLQFDLPSLDNSNIELSDSDIKDSGIVYEYINQGCCIINGKFYFACGVRGITYAPPILIVVDKNYNVETRLDMEWIYEPQNCFRYKGSLVVGTSGPNYYVLSFN